MLRSSILFSLLYATVLCSPTINCRSSNWFDDCSNSTRSSSILADERNCTCVDDIQQLLADIEPSVKILRLKSCRSDAISPLTLHDNVLLLNVLTVTHCPINRIVLNFTDYGDERRDVPIGDGLEMLAFSSSGLKSFEIVQSSQLSQLVTLNLQFNLLNEGNFSLLPALKHLDISGNEFTAVPLLPDSLMTLNLSGNPIAELNISDFRNLTNLTTLDLSRCSLRSLSTLAASIPVNIRYLYLSGNRVKFLPDPKSLSRLQFLTVLDLSSNLLETFDGNVLSGLNKLTILKLNKNHIRTVRSIPDGLDHLEELYFENNKFLYFDLQRLSPLRNLQRLSLRDNYQLRSMLGSAARHAPQLRYLDIANCLLAQLPIDFFANDTLLSALSISDNPWHCGCCLSWMLNVRSVVQIDSDPITRCNDSQLFSENCTLGLTVQPVNTIMTNYGSTVVMDCGVYGRPTPTIRWERRTDNLQLGEWGWNSSTAESDLDRRGIRVLPGGLLYIEAANTSHVNQYRCVVSSQLEPDRNVSAVFLLRFDYSSWTMMKVFSVICGILTAILFFILNVVYAAIRRLIIWRISRLEQTSRVRLLLEAIEKYRQRQMDSLHDKYTTKMNHIRENYHIQVDQMRKGYVAQSERFRDYRAAQFESVSHHIDSLRDNYVLQRSRMREYGSRQLERLWESYQKRSNRLRAFTLQQRLRLMRQYKIKQQYWNTLFESVSAQSAHLSNGNPATFSVELIQLPHITADDELNLQVSPEDVETISVHSSASTVYSIANGEMEFNEELAFAVADLDDCSFHSIPDEMQLQDVGPCSSSENGDDIEQSFL